MVAAIYRFFTRDPHRGAAFDSLSLGKLTAERDGAVVWSPEQAGGGVEADPRGTHGRLSQRPAPPDARLWHRSSPAARPIERGWTTRNPPVLSQPLYRYEDTKGDLIDGGLFVFVHGGAPRSSC